MSAPAAFPPAVRWRLALRRITTPSQSHCENVPDYMISGSRGDFTGVGDIHFFYSSDEVLYGALPDFEEACKHAKVPYTAFARPKMVHCYCMLPYFKEAKEDFAKITDILKK
mgnify:CR=1 FL=1